jgi:hypothetical protein
MFNEKANKEYIKTQLEIDQEIERLKDNLAGHNEKAIDINWGHVGDMKHILAQLKQINRKEEE